MNTLDWTNMPVLIGPRFRRILSERGDREKLARAHMKRAKGPKKHSTNKERSFHERKKAFLQKLAIEQATRERHAYLLAAREYWLGEREEHP